MRAAPCHPDRLHHGKNLCKNCYNIAKAKERRRKNRETVQSLRAEIARLKAEIETLKQQQRFKKVS